MGFYGGENRAFSMGIGPGQTKLPPSESSHRAGYGGGIVRVLAPILGRSAASEVGNRFSS